MSVLANMWLVEKFYVWCVLWISRKEVRRGKKYRGCQPVSHGHHHMGSLVLRDMHRILHTRLSTRCSALSNSAKKLCVVAVIMVTTNWAAILWVLWRHTDGLCINAGFRLTCRSPLCRVIIACCFRVAALSGNAALALSPSGIAPKLNRIQLSAICRGGQSGKVID